MYKSKTKLIIKYHVSIFNKFTDLQNRPFASSCLSFRTELNSHWTVFTKFGTWVFLQDLSRNSSFLRIWQEWQILYMKTYVHLLYYLT